MKRYYVSMWTKRGHFWHFTTNSFKLAKSLAIFKLVYIIKITDRKTYDIVFYRKREEP